MTQPPAPAAVEAPPFKAPDQQTAYNTAQAAVEGLLGKGWTIAAMRPAYQAGVSDPNAVGSNKPPLQIGAIVDVIGPGGEKDSITVGPSDTSVTWDLTPGPDGKLKPLQAGIVVLKGPTNQPSPGSQPGSAITDWVRIDANGKEIAKGDTTTPAVYIRDPKAPATTPPYKLEEDQKLGDPKSWQPITNPNDPNGAVIGLFDPKTSKLAASVPAKPNAQPSGDLKPLIDPNDPAHKRVIGLIDQGDFSIHPVSQTPDGKQVVLTDTGIYVVDKDTGEAKLSQTITKSQTPSVFTHPDGSIYMVDPNEKDPNKKLTRLQGQQPPQTIKQQTPGGEVTLVYNPETHTYEMPPGTTAPASVDAPGSAALQFIVYRDDKGNEIFKSKNPNWQGFTQPAEPTVSTTAKFVPRWNKEKGVWEDVPNVNRIPASDALKAMAAQVTGQAIAGDLSEDEAIKLLTAANAKMANDIAAQNAQLSAASTALTAGAQGAQTGAGLLNQRVQAGSQMLGQVLGFAGQSHLRGLPEGAGQAIMGDIQGFATQLGGGQDVYDTAVRLVHAADPSAPNELTAKATAFINQVLNKQIQETGELPPVVKATQALKANLAANAQGGQGGFTPTPTVPVQTPAVASGQMMPAGGNLPGQNYGPGTGYTGGVAPSSYGFTPPGGSGYSYGGPVPWAGAIPQPLPQGFVVPVTTPLPPPQTVLPLARQT
jgi:hypothetical protein